MALASSGVRVLAFPWPCRTPPCVKLPDITWMVLVPIVWICASIEDCAPVPSATMVITAATPMIMPSMVSAVRSLLRPSAFSAIRKIIKTDMVTPRLPTVDRRPPPPVYPTAASSGSAASSSSACRLRVTG